MSERGTSAQPISERQLADTSRPSHLALYRKYRPETLDELIGQPQVTDILKNTAKTGNFAHAYLFTGQRGTGKTSAARILAHLINGTEYGSDDLDIIEIDAASRGSVDDARELREKAFLAPIAASHKIYIIDEVHMLSTQAFNALLKIIEEPPDHIVFIMATTELSKVPATILSRVQRFHFKSVTPDIIIDHLKHIAKREGFQTEPAALALIAHHGGGSFRDSITLLDQLSGNGSITADNVEDVLGLAPEAHIATILTSIAEHNVITIVKTVNELLASGISPHLIARQLTTRLLEMAPDKPKLYTLVDSLLEISKSAAPDVKLLATLALAATKPGPNTILAASTTSQRDDKLAVIIEKKVQREPKLIHETKANSVTDASSQQVAASIEPESVKEDAVKAIKTNSTVPVLTDINWQDILDELKSLDRPAALATLKFANAEYENDTLTLYFERAFHRKKADATSCRESLRLACSNLYQTAPRVVIATTAQLAVESKNSLVANVAAIMGGGDIVKEI